MTRRTLGAEALRHRIHAMYVRQGQSGAGPSRLAAGIHVGGGPAPAPGCAATTRGNAATTSAGSCALGRYRGDMLGCGVIINGDRST
jgi:hypothetical protein